MDEPELFPNGKKPWEWYVKRVLDMTGILIELCAALWALAWITREVLKAWFHLINP